MDVLSDVLRVVRLSGARFLRFDFCSPWSVSSVERPEMARSLGVSEDRFMGFHVMVEGACWLTMDGHPPVRLLEGDVAVLPHGDGHALCDDQALVPLPVATLMPADPRGELPRIRYGGQGPTTRILCGFLRCEQMFHLLSGALPPLLHVRRRRVAGERAEHADEDPAAPREAVEVEPGDWLDVTLNHMASEVERNQPGATAMIARLGELLYMEVLRRYMNSLWCCPSNWLAAVQDPDVGVALRLIHSDPARDWEVEGLARSVGVSRSLLAQRFTALVGQPPIRYLAEWRLQLARQMLMRQGTSVAQVADSVGYASEAAFNRAFKRYTGHPPATWRRLSADQDAGPPPPGACC